MNAVFAADAVARLSGTVGVAAVTAGPGISADYLTFLFIQKYILCKFK